MTRADVTFQAGDDRCAAWLYTPTDIEDQDRADRAATPTPRPIIVMAHGLGGVKEEGLEAFAERFTAAGYRCLVFDYRHFGDSEGEPRNLIDIAQQRDDWRAAVAFARTLDGVDPDQVIVWGTSFSGGHVIVTAAEDSRIAAAISQCPFTDGVASSMATPAVTSVKVSARALIDAVGSRLGREPVTVPTYGPPGVTALMTAPDVVAGIERILPPAMRHPKDVPARFTLGVIRDSPGRKAKDVACPILFAICERDSVAPAGPTRKYAALAPRGEAHLYDAGHFDIYVGDEFERNVADQLDFLARHVPAR